MARPVVRENHAAFHSQIKSVRDGSKLVAVVDHRFQFLGVPLDGEDDRPLLDAIRAGGDGGDDLTRVGQAEPDRERPVRAELDRRDALDDYRDAWAERAGKELTTDALSQRGVVIISMPDAPTAVVSNLTSAATSSPCRRP